MPLTRFQRSPLILSPALLALSTWSAVAVLYGMHLSNLLLFSTADVLGVIFMILAPALSVSLLFWLVYAPQAVPLASTVVLEQPSVELISRRLRYGVWLWIACAAVETVVSGGIPLLWILIGSSKTYFDYGIPSIHGVVNALLMAITTTSFALFLFTGRRRYLKLPLFSVAWFAVLITRGTLVFVTIECLLIYLRFRRVHWMSILRLVGFGAVLLLLFGFAGDLRSGAEAFKTLAQPSADYPEWAPSGVLWAYIYITTPINNLLYSMHIVQPAYNLLLPNTASTLFPTIIRNLVYGRQAAEQAISGNLVVDALNVSTAYVGSFQDLGRAGIVGLSALLSFLNELYWRRNGFRNVLIYAVFGQALILSLFYNLLFSLPILGQIIWFFYFTHQPRPAAAGPELLHV